MSTFDKSFSERWGNDDPSAIAHAFKPEYDPVKAHEYYMRTRKLKGKKAQAKTPDAVKKEYQSKVVKFLGSLPMAKGGDLKKTAAFVKRMRSMTDDQMTAEAQKLARPPAGQKVSQESMAQIATINALLKNRTRVRAASGTGSKQRYTPRVFEDGSVSIKPIMPPTKKRVTRGLRSMPPRMAGQFNG